MFLMRSLGLNINLEALLGSIFTFDSYLSTWVTGFLVHLCIGAFLGVFYGLAFEAVGRSGPLMGAGLGLANGLLAGMLMTSIPAMSPFSGATGTEAPGAFLTNVSYGPILFLAAHAIYGLVLGSAYGRTSTGTYLHPKPVA
jgi:hypothetical protein